jgi:hypothetical protein
MGQRLKNRRILLFAITAGLAWVWPWFELELLEFDLIAYYLLGAPLLLGIFAASLRSERRSVVRLSICLLIVTGIAWGNACRETIVFGDDNFSFEGEWFDIAIFLAFQLWLVEIAFVAALIVQCIFSAVGENLFVLENSRVRLADSSSRGWFYPAQTLMIASLVAGVTLALPRWPGVLNPRQDIGWSSLLGLSESDAREMLGPPIRQCDRRACLPQGDHGWVYYKDPFGRQQLHVLFDADNIVTGYQTIVFR